MSGEQIGMFDPGPCLEALRKEARQQIGRCHCCGGKSKLYRRKLNASMAGAMCAMFGLAGQEWVHLKRVPRHLINGGEISALLHWGLLELKKNEGTKKRISGIWRLTEKGSWFVHRQIRVPTHAFIRTPGDIFVAWEETETTVIDALGKRFDYAELMAGL